VDAASVCLWGARLVEAPMILAKKGLFVLAATPRTPRPCSCEPRGFLPDHIPVRRLVQYRASQGWVVEFFGGGGKSTAAATTEPVRDVGSITAWCSVPP
jgi:hypothetical protein